MDGIGWVLWFVMGLLHRWHRRRPVLRAAVGCWVIGLRRRFLRMGIRELGTVSRKLGMMEVMTME